MARIDSRMLAAARRGEPIKALPTRYRGVEYRSRTEARWAVFMDALGVKHVWEFQGYDLGKAGYYLPDFWLPELEVFLEVKGQEPSEEEIGKLWALQELTGHAAFFAVGQPDPGEAQLWGFWQDSAGNRSCKDLERVQVFFEKVEKEGVHLAFDDDSLFIYGTPPPSVDLLLELQANEQAIFRTAKYIEGRRKDESTRGLLAPTWWGVCEKEGSAGIVMSCPCCGWRECKRVVWHPFGFEKNCYQCAHKRKWRHVSECSPGAYDAARSERFGH